MKTERFQINLEILPKALQQELIDYYKYLIFKHKKDKNNKSQKKDFFDSVKSNKYSLPNDYQFDRDLANER
jgi:hypothetical protein